MQGRTVEVAKKTIAYAAFADPRDTHMSTIVEDYNRRIPVLEPTTQVISALNSKNLGVLKELPELPDAIYAEYLDRNDKWTLRRDIFYRAGFTAETAKLFETIPYLGFTDSNRVDLRATFDLAQPIARSRKFSREMDGVEGLSMERGKFVLLNDDIVEDKHAFGRIKSIQTSGANITGITLDNILPLSGTGAEIDPVTGEFTDSPQMAVTIRLTTGQVITKPITDIADSKVLTFVTPFVLAGTGIEEGLSVVSGIAGRESIPCIVFEVIPKGLETRTIILVDEGNELHR
jgi:hypothetical protein